MRRLLLPLFLALSACQGAPVTQPPGTTTPSSVSPSAAPGVQPTPAPSTSAAPSQAPLSGQRLGNSELVAPAALAKDPLTGDLLVIDQLKDYTSPPRFGLRRYSAAGAFKEARSLSADETALPTAVGAVGTEGRGFPVFTSSETSAEQGKTFLKVRLPSGVEALAGYPVSLLGKVGLTALGFAGTELGLAYQLLGSDPTARISTVIAEPGETARRIATWTSPFVQVKSLAYDQKLNLALLGVDAAGKAALWSWPSTEDSARAWVQAFSYVPEKAFPLSNGEVLVTEKHALAPTKIHRYSAQGVELASSELRLADGGYLADVVAIREEGAGFIALARGVGKDGTFVSSLYKF